VILISVLCSSIFLVWTENEIREVSLLFKIHWYDPIKAILGGVVLGVFMRIVISRPSLETRLMSIRSYTSLILWIGLISLTGGVLSAVILYFRFGNSDLYGLPIHVAILGLGSLIAYAVLNWDRCKQSNKKQQRTI